MLVQRRKQFVLGCGTVIYNGVLLGEQVAHLCEQLLRGECHNLLVRQASLHTLLAIDYIRLQSREVARLVQFGVSARFEHILLNVCQNRLVGNSVSHQILNDIHRLVHILAQTADRNSATRRTCTQIKSASQTIELRLNLLGCLRQRTQILGIVKRKTQCGVVQRTQVEHILQREVVGSGVLLVEHLDTRLRLEAVHILLEIDKARLDRLHLRRCNSLEEVALSVAVGYDRSDLGLSDLLLVGILTLTLVDDGVVLLTQLLVSETHNVLLSDLRQAVEYLNLVLPLRTVDERLNIHIGTTIVRIEVLHSLQLIVVHRRSDQSLVELACTQLSNLAEQQITHLFERLTLLGTTCQLHITIVGRERRIAISAQRLLLLIDIEVYQTCLTVVENATHDVCQISVLRCCATQTPADSHVCSVQTPNLLNDRLGDGLLGLELQYGDLGIGLHIAKVLVDERDHLLGIEITRQTDCHIVGHVVLIVVVLHVGNRGVLQVLLRTQHRLLAVGVVGEQRAVHRLIDLATVLRERHILLLVDGFKLGVETTNHNILEAVSLDFEPILDLIRGNVLDIHGHIVTRVGVGTLRTDGCHQLVVLVGNSQLRRLVADRVNALVDRLALSLVLGLAIDLEQLLNLVEHRLLGRIVLSTELLRTLEHQVLEVVSQAGGLRGVVLTTHTHSDIGLNTRFLLAYRHIDFQTVIQRVDTGLRGIALDAFIGVLRSASREQHCRHDRHQC